MKARLFATALLLALSSWVHATWTDEGSNVYSCTTGICAMTCDADNACNNFTFIATHTAEQAQVSCEASNACASATFFLAAKTSQSVICSEVDACDDLSIYVGVPGSGSTGMDVAVPSGFQQSDFYGAISSFSLMCLVTSSCNQLSLNSFYAIAGLSVSCAETDSCKDMNIDAASITGNISLGCFEEDACNNVNFTTRTDGTAQCVDNDAGHCASVTVSANAAPVPDVDLDGVPDANDLCPTGVSNGAGAPLNADANGDGCDDVAEALLDDDGDGVPNILDGRTLTWNGSFFDVLPDFFDESKWLDNGVAAAADVINPDQVIGREIEMGNVTMQLDNHLSVLLGYGNSLTLNNTRLFGQANTAFRPTATEGGTATITLNQRANLRFGWIWDIELILDGESRATALGADTSADTGVIGKNTTVNFKGEGASLLLQNVSVEDAEVLVSKFLVDGAAADLNINLVISPFGMGAEIWPDYDEDGLVGGADWCPKGNPVITDWDNDGCDDATEDDDDDNDGVPDWLDMCPESVGSNIGSDGCEIPDEDKKGNGDGKPDDTKTKKSGGGGGSLLWMLNMLVGVLLWRRVSVVSPAQTVVLSSKFL